MNFKLKGPSRFGRTFSFYLKWLLSYVWPIRLAKSTDSKQVAELVLQYGKLVINSGEANYSYGSLQAAFEDYFKEEDWNWSSANRILILGFGSGSILQTLRNEYNSEAEVVGIESDQQIIEWYHEYFPNLNVDLKQCLAQEYIQTEQEPYDLIIVDVFIGLDVPEECRSQDFIANLQTLLNVNGLVVLNFVIDKLAHEEQYSDLLLALSRQFKQVKAFPQMEINRIISCKK